MQLLKSLVIGMAAVIVLGMAFLAYSLYRKAAEPDWNPFAGAPGAPPGSAAPFGTLRLDLPAGCVIAGVRPDGAGPGGFAYIIIKPAGARRGAAAAGPCNRIIVVDPRRGRVMGTIEGPPDSTPTKPQ